MRYLDRLQPLALLVMRLALGAIMVVHGYHNVFGGLQHHAQWIASLGVPRWLGYVSSFTELVGGLLLLAGFFTRIAASRSASTWWWRSGKFTCTMGSSGSPDRPGYEFPLGSRQPGLRLDLLWRRSHRSRPRSPRRRQRRVQTVGVP